MEKVNCILLVDDNPADNEIHKLKIIRANLCNHIKMVNSAAEALDYLTQSGNPDLSEQYPRPDIIFLDINMPGMNGFDFLEKYKELNERLKSKIVIIMLSVSLDPENEKKASESKEITEFMNKPLEIENLKMIIEKYL